MLLKYFTEEAYERLYGSIADNTEKYLGEEDWLGEFFSGGEEYFKTSSVMVGQYKPYYVPGKKSDEQKCEEDLINVRYLYDAFKNLTPQQASNKYMWTYLCHGVPEYYKYIKDRWFFDGLRDKTIERRMFVTGVGNLYNDNALSRLWWYGYLTYDEENRADPYALTKILMTNLTICTDIIDTHNSANGTRLRGVLYGLRDYMEAIGTSRGVSEDMRMCNKYLNHYAAVSVMEFLSVEEIRDLTFNKLMEIHEKKTAADENGNVVRQDCRGRKMKRRWEP